MNSGEPAPTPPVIETDALVVGAGPVGLFQVFQLGLLDIEAHIVDALPHLGGQPAALYPDKPIYDVPGVPVCTGRELAEALWRQASPFRPGLHLSQTVVSLERQWDDRLLVGTSGGTRFLARTLFIAAGIGAFLPRTLKIEGLDAFEGTQLFHRLEDVVTLRGRRVLVVGGGEEAVDTVLRICRAAERHPDDRPAQLTLVHRRDAFTAPEEALQALQGLRARGQVRFVAGMPTDIEVDDGHLSGLRLLTPEGIESSEPLDVLIVALGLLPQLGPIAKWGLAMERKQLVVDPERFQTSEPAVFAVGDINTYPGKKKLLVCGFHECTLAAYAAAPIVHPGRPVVLQYTTTSTRLHERLGVAHPTKG
jgi:thioredoxin reductase (NADPH)